MIAQPIRHPSAWRVCWPPGLIFATIVSVMSSLQAQTPPDSSIGHLHGTLTDESGAAVPAAKVMFKSDGATYSTTTSAVGIYDIDLSSGIYEMDVAKPGFCYRRAPFRMPAAFLTINAALPLCAIAQVATITEGAATVKDELRPSFMEETVSIPGQDAPQLKLLITYRNREEDADITTYFGYTLRGALDRVVVTYNCLTISAKSVRFDHRALWLYAEDSVTIENGKQLSTSDQATVRFEKGKPVVVLN